MHNYIYTKQFSSGYDINKYVKELKLTKLSDCESKIKPDTIYTYIECDKDGNCELYADDVKYCLDNNLFNDISKVYIDLNSADSKQSEFNDKGRRRFDYQLKILKKFPELDKFGYVENEG